MSRISKATVLSTIVFASLHVSFVDAQAPATPPPVVTGNFGGGLALTSGNSDTKNFNVSFAVVRDPKTRNVVKLNGLYLRGDKDKNAIIDRTTIGLRDEYTFSKNVFAFGQLEYLRDKFKDILYLWSPTGGLGYKLINTDAVLMTIDAGLGGIWERNPGRATQKSGAVNSAERLNWKFSKTSSITQSISGLWKTDRFSDALYNLSAGIAATLTRNSELKFEVIDIYKTRPPVVTLKKNDVAVVTAVVLKF